jgi:hypothetical protein
MIKSLTFLLFSLQNYLPGQMVEIAIFPTTVPVFLTGKNFLAGFAGFIFLSAEIKV